MRNLFKTLNNSTLHRRNSLYKALYKYLKLLYKSIVLRREENNIC